MRRSNVAIGLLSLLFFIIIAVSKGQALEATPTSLEFTAVQGGSNPVTQAVSFLKKNPRKPNWITSNNAAWLNLTLSPANPSDQLLVGVNVAGLTTGVYTGKVSIADINGESTSIPVTIKIAAPFFTRLTLTPSPTMATAPFRRTSNTEAD